MRWIKALLMPPSFRVILAVRSRPKGIARSQSLNEPKSRLSEPGWWFRLDFCAKNQATIENFLKALLDGQSFINRSENKPAVLKIMGSYLREKNPAALEDGFQVLSTNMNRKPFSSAAGLNNIKRMLTLSNPKAGNVKPETLIDDSLLRNFDRSGILDRALAGSL
jgi:hypothetical protein